MRLFVALVIAAAVLLARQETARAGASARLVYVRGPGAEGCPAEAAVRAAVATRLGYDPFFPWAKESLFAEVTREKGGAYRAEIKLVDEENRLLGDRSLTMKGDDCGAVIDAMGLTISLTIDPSSITGKSAPAPATAPEPPSAPAAPAPTPPSDGLSTPAIATPPAGEKPRTPRPTSDAVHVHAGAGAFGVLGAEPSLSAGASVFVGLAWRSLSLDLEGRADLPTTASSEIPQAEVRSWLAAGALVPCVHLGAAFGCPVLAIGSVQASAVNVTTPSPAQDLWVGAGGRLGLELPIAGSWFLRGYGELLGAVHGDRLYIGTAEAFRFPVASGAIGLGFMVRLP
jgi:hypothetical protein